MCEDPFMEMALRHLLPAGEAVLWDGQGRLPEDGPVLALVRDLAEARQALGAGALGVMERSLDEGRLLAAVAAVEVGLRVVDPAFEGLLPTTRGEGPVEPLTPREQQVLECLAAGASNRGVGRRLGITDSTAKFHVNAVLLKLDARNRTDAVVKAARMGLLTL